jgi:hypothetical protein
MSAGRSLLKNLTKDPSVKRLWHSVMASRPRYVVVSEIA